MRLIFAVMLIALLSACANTPKFDLAGVNASLTPKTASADINTAKGQMIVWGGVILSSENLKTFTQIEVLAYPLDSSFLPLLNNEPLGRYIIHHPGFVETTIFEAGRMVSVTGSAESTQTGKVGEAEYIYPVVNSKQLHLWSPDSGRSRTTFHFGLGVQL